MIKKRKTYIEPTEKNVVHALYTCHKTKGVVYSREKEEELVLRLLHGETTETDVFFIERKIRDVMSLIEHGHWKSAKNEIINFVTVEGAFSQIDYDVILTDINEYINTYY